MKRNRLAPVADVPGVCEFGNDIHGYGIIRTGTDKAVIGRRDRRKDPPERGLMHVIEGDLFIAGAEELPSIAGLLSMGCG
jgi:hypothetical protein